MVPWTPAEKSPGWPCTLVGWKVAPKKLLSKNELLVLPQGCPMQFVPEVSDDKGTTKAVANWRDIEEVGALRLG